MDSFSTFLADVDQTTTSRSRDSWARKSVYTSIRSVSSELVNTTIGLRLFMLAAPGEERTAVHDVRDRTRTASRHRATGLGMDTEKTIPWPLMPVMCTSG